MKNVIVGAVCSMVFFLVLACVMTVNGRTVRQNNLDNAINRAVDQTVAELRNKDGVIQLTEEEFISELTGNIVHGINDDSEIDIKILNCNLEKGIMSISVTKNFKHPNGSIGTVTSEKTCIWEEYENLGIC